MEVTTQTAEAAVDTQPRTSSVVPQPEAAAPDPNAVPRESSQHSFKRGLRPPSANDVVPNLTRAEATSRRHDAWTDSSSRSASLSSWRFIHHYGRTGRSRWSHVQHATQKIDLRTVA